MNRNQMIQQLESRPAWDICIIGGGASGLGAALDAASRGLKTVLFEEFDFAKGTSSRSTKLVHGGVRYLQQGNIRLVMEALKERGLLLKNAPHLVHNQQFIVPNYKWWEKPYYGIGLKIYDKMAGKLGLGPSQFLSRDETLALSPTLDPEGLKGGVVYHDGQFDDARLAISLAQTAANHGAVLINYMPVTGLLKKQNRVCGVWVKDNIGHHAYEVLSKVVINATGVFTDEIRHMDDPDNENLVQPSQGIHLVVDKSFLPGDAAIMIPRTDDGRVLFAVPWHRHIVLGTTDTPVSTPLPEPTPSEDEITYVLGHIGRYLTKQPEKKDVKSMFAGLRPLIKGKHKTTAALSRDHLIDVSSSGLITITGGKWTTYRKMAEEVIDLSVSGSGLEARPCITKALRLSGSDQPVMPAEIPVKEEGVLKQYLQRAIREEMCMTVEDFLARRTRQLFLDAKKAIQSAPLVATLMAALLNKDNDWVEGQIHIFNETAKHYLPRPDSQTPN